MANQKITDLRTLNGETVAREDLIPIVDISENTSPTGELKKISFNQIVLSVTAAVLSELTNQINGKANIAHTHPISDVNGLTEALSASIPQISLAKAWVNFNGVTGVIRSSHNVSSVTKDSTGKYTVNFITPVGNNACVLCTGMVGGPTSTEDDQLTGVYEINTNYIKISSIDATSAGTNFEDSTIINAVVFSSVS